MTLASAWAAGEGLRPGRSPRAPRLLEAPPEGSEPARSSGAWAQEETRAWRSPPRQVFRRLRGIWLHLRFVRQNLFARSLGELRTFVLQTSCPRITENITELHFKFM